MSVHTEFRIQPIPAVKMRPKIVDVHAASVAERNNMTLKPFIP